MRSLGKLATIVFSATLALWVGPSSAFAARVTGVFVGNGGPLAGRQLHFENDVTQDIFVAATGQHGKFHADLPPGHYSLRQERGTILIPDIAVGRAPINLGTVNEPGFSLLHLFQLQGLAPALIQTPAPSTAYIPNETAEGDLYSVVPALPATALASPPQARQVQTPGMTTQLPKRATSGVVKPPALPMPPMKPVPALPGQPAPQY